MTERWYVHVVPFDVAMDKSQVLGKSQSMDEHAAKKLEAGLARNIDMNRFYTMLSTSDESDPLTGRPMSLEPFNRVLLITIGHERKNLNELTKRFKEIGGLWVDEDGSYSYSDERKPYLPRFRFTVGQIGRNAQWLITILPTGSGRPDVEIEHAQICDQIKQVLFTSTSANWVEAVFGGEEYCDGITDSSQRWHAIHNRKEMLQAVTRSGRPKDR